MTFPVSVIADENSSPMCIISLQLEAHQNFLSLKHSNQAT